jgi:60 kDa SS-A/Ro ribonucleoprotein
MANKTLFSSKNAPKAPFTDTVNAAGGRAYSMTAKHALSQLASTGCFSDTFYTSAEDQMTKVMELVPQVDPEFIAKLAVYSREKGFMKDMPAYLTAYLSTVSPEYLSKVFPRVIDNGKMLRNFVQIIRSGAVGRRSFGSAPRRLIRNWFEGKTDRDVFFNSTGNDPSLADVIKLTRPRPANKTREALYAYFLGKEPKAGSELPEAVQAYEQYRKEKTGELPDVPFEMLTGLDLSDAEWKNVARKATWTQTRMNLATFARHNVFKLSNGKTDSEMTKLVAEKLRNREAIKKSKCFPYQLLMAYKMTEDNKDVPSGIINALQDAMEVATENVPVLPGKWVIAVDISGSMGGLVTGGKGDKRTLTKVRFLDVAALVAASFMRVNPDTRIIPFESKALTDFRLNSRDSVMTNAKKLTGLPCGGTNCSAPLVALADEKAEVDGVIFVSDNESWIDGVRYGSFAFPSSDGWSWSNNNSTKARTMTMDAWEKIRRVNPKAKMVCIDIAPGTTTQAINRADILNIGGFSDNVWDVISAFATGNGAAQWADVIDKITL